MSKKQEYKFHGNTALAVYEEKRFDVCFKTIIENGATFCVIHKPYSIELKRGEKYKMAGFKKKEMFYSGICKVFYDQLSDKLTSNQYQCVSEMHADIVKNVTNLIKDGKLRPIQPITNWGKSLLFRDNWENLEVGALLWYTDFDNFYPTIASRLGYLHPDLVKKYSDDQYKRVRNMALSKLASAPWADYYIDGKLSHTIRTDKDLVEDAFKNVYMFAKNFVDHLCIRYRWAVVGRDIDNLIVPFEFKTFVASKYIEAQGFDWKFYLAQKISDNEIKILYDKRTKRYHAYDY